MKKELDIVICLDKNFILGCGTLILSILKHNPETIFYFHLCAPSEDIDRINKKLICRIRELYNSDVCAFYLRSFESFERYRVLSVNLNKRRATQCARLLIGEIDNYHNRRILFIDSDVICISNIDLIFNINFCNTDIVAASKGESCKKTVCGYVCNGYYWAGLLIVDIEKWNDFNVGKKCIDFIISNNPVYQDQDALNVILNNKFKEIPSYWHYMWNKVDGTAFVHFPGSKPWDPWGYRNHPKISNLFRKYAKEFEPNVSKWISFKKNKDVLVNFNNYKTRFAFKWLAFLFLKKKKYLSFLIFYMKHLFVKVKQKGIIGLILLKSNTRT